MARLNVARKQEVIRTHEGAVAKRINHTQALRRSVMCCMLWEKEFYEDGESIAARIAELIPKVPGPVVSCLAIEARINMKLRHVPLFIAVEMLKHDTHRKYVRKLLANVIERADELTEVLAIYWKDGRKPLRKQLRRGIADAFKNFNEYELSKYNRDSEVKLRDVLFLTHPKPEFEGPSKWSKAVDRPGYKRGKTKRHKTGLGVTYKALANNALSSADTWEVALSAGENKGTVFTRLIMQKKLGAMAMLRNLRNMQEASVDPAVIRKGIVEMKTERVLPFRFISAVKYAPRYEPELEEAMIKCLKDAEKFKGNTILLVDVSSSMDAPVSSKSEISRLEAACGVGILVRQLMSCAVFTFSNKLIEVPARRGFALRDAIVQSQPHLGTDLGGALQHINQIKCDRLIVITDEQSATEVPSPHAKCSYMINVASAQNGVGYGKWTHIDGWSESVISFIRELERTGDK